jgi:GNAT superfamily N-acetyltransferase
MDPAETWAVRVDGPAASEPQDPAFPWVYRPEAGGATSMGPSAAGPRQGTARPDAPSRAIRPAHLRDIGGLVRMYRGQSMESRAFHHPYPADRLRLTTIFTWMVLSGHVSRLFLRTVPSLGFVLLVACPNDSDVPVGYGTIRFVGSRRTEIWARFGFLVQEDARGHGLGGQLAEALWERSLELGVRRGGGTIVKANTVSRAIVEHAGFELAPTSEPDKYTPGAETLGGLADLEEVLARHRASRHRPTGANDDPSVPS